MEDDATAAQEAEDGAAEPFARPVRKPSRAVRILLLIALFLTIVLAGVWLQRKPIADRIVRDELARRGVPARYHIADLGLSRQRLTDVVIGDPDHPDLVADWVEVSTDISLRGASVTALRAGHVRLRGRLVDGQLKLGAIDRLLPPPTGKPFALPSLNVAVEDARMRLDTPYGVVGLKVAGTGKLDDGFSGTLAAVAPELAVAGCTVERLAAAVHVTIGDGRPSLEGPVRAAAAQCEGAAASHPALALDATLGEALDRWKGSADLTIAKADVAAATADRVRGTVTFEGGPERTTGTVELASDALAGEGLHAGETRIAGRYAAGTKGNRFGGAVHGGGVALSRATIQRVAGLAGAADGTPAGPLVDKLVRAAVLAGRAMDVRAELSAEQTDEGGHIGVSRMTMTARSGARATLSGGTGIRYRWPDAGLTLDGMLAFAGGDLPEAAIRLHQARAGAPVRGTALFRPYAADGARLALTPVDFEAAADGSTRFTTRATISGPIGPDGRVSGLTMPVSARWNGGGRLVINRTCVPLSFDRLAVSGLELDATRLALCPEDAALLRITGAGVRGGAQIANADLTGRIGGTPLALTADASEFRLTDNGFRLQNVAARIGGESVTRIAADLTGRVGDGDVAGRFSDGSGQIGSVPLLMSDAAGAWRLADGVLTLDGALKVDDAAEDPRFEQLASDDFHFTLDGNRIDAAGTLKTPEGGVKVSDVTIAHDLGTGTGHAVLDVPGIAFDEDFQPERLTRLTFGVIADVRGAVSGKGRIEWTSEDVTSTGTFATTGTDLSAAFGTVTGLSTTIHFTDLLNLKTAPDQLATIAEVNPGIAAIGGVIHYQVLDSERVRIEGGEWPFAGGTLILEPTVLDFGEKQQRRLTFRLRGVEAAQFLQQFDFDNINATGTFDGVLPMVFDESGGRIVDGHLETRAGGTLAYIGEVSEEDLGTWGNLAFNALKSIRYDSLTVTLDGPLAGEMVTRIRFAGVHQGEGAEGNFIVDRLAKLPLRFNIRIKAPFRQLIDSVQSYYEPERLIERNLPSLIEEQKNQAQDPKNTAGPSSENDDGAVQPTESEAMP
ncbi:YdbH domain-containing protein [Stakelama saccharophila]|uniref:YdbH domain-containing protein n=1 Tax=Stakelama saccharophila TaxID=3075605 RepID=A0ABZ0BB48_9SPHN|nr:YdbH domain-containing protein [Stakelama sp. W311]WNO54651.1 YdbH domain-containing protein [Stakelama sp. W311]